MEKEMDLMQRRLIHMIGSYRKVLVDQRNGKTAGWDATLTEKENDSGELIFTIAMNNPEFNALSTMVSEIVLEDDGVEVWRGRITGQSTDSPANKTITVKGLLDYLYDSIIPPQAFSGTAAEVMDALLSAHNASGVEARKHFSLGTVSGIGNISYELTQPKKAWEVVKALIREYGGAVFCRRDGDINYLDWLAEGSAYRHTCSQPIVYGKNLISLETEISGDDIATVIYGYGKKTDGVYLTCADVNDGLKYVTDEDAVAAFGWIEDAMIRTDIESGAELLSVMEKELSARMEEVRCLTAAAVDLSDTGQDYERLASGMYARLRSQPHNIDEIVKVDEIKRYIFAPHPSKISLGASLSAASKILRRV